MESKNVIDNPFSKYLLELMNNTLSVKREGMVIGVSNRKLLTDKEKYIVDVFCIHKNILELLESLNYVVTFMKRYDSDVVCYNENGIDIIKYVKYHLETFAYKASTIRDLSFKLINEIYQLHLKDKDCDWQHISKKNDIINQDVFTSLNLFYFLFKRLITVRNIIAHTGENPIPDFDELEPYIFLYHITKNKEDKEYIKTKHDYLIIVKQIIEQKKIYENGLQKHIDNANVLIKALFENLEKDFIAKINSF